MKHAFVAVLTLLIASAFAISQDTSARFWSPPDIAGFDPAAKPTKPTEMVSSLRINGFPVVLEETDLHAVQHRFEAVIGHGGDAGESVQWVCLRGESAGQRLVLWVESSEIDGGKVGGFQVRQIDANAKLDPRCHQVAIPSAVLTLPKAIHVGMTESDLLKTLGKPTAGDRDALLFAHAHRVVIRHEPYDSENDVIVLLRQGKVYAVQVRKTTSS